MSFKDKLKNSWKYLPVGSAVAYVNEIRRKNEVDSNGKVLFHTAYPAIVFGFLVASLMYGTPNVKKWPEIAEHGERARQEYNELYDQAVRCVEQDGISGLNLNELGELYSRAGVNVGVNPNLDPRAVTFRLPRLTRKNLEKVVYLDCEVPGKRR